MIGEGITLDDKLLAGVEDFVPPVSGPEMVGLALAGDNGPPSKICMTQGMWDRIRSQGYDEFLEGKAWCSPALLLERWNPCKPGPEKNAGLILLGMMVAIQLRMFYTVDCTLQAEAQVSVVSAANLKQYIAAGTGFAKRSAATTACPWFLQGSRSIDQGMGCQNDEFSNWLFHFQILKMMMPFFASHQAVPALALTTTSQLFPAG